MPFPLVRVLSLLLPIRLVHAQAVPSPTGCPASVGIQNGNFDSGQFAPWTVEPPNPAATISIVSPGYNSAHALQLDFASANVTSFSFVQNMGLQCEGGTYSTSFAVNYLNYSLHGNPATNFCHLSVISSYCFTDGSTPSPGYYNASLTPGWESYTYVCTARKSGYADFVVGVGCEADYVIPAFTWLLDDFDIHLVGTSISSSSTPPYSTPTPTPPPSSSSTAPYSNTTSVPATTPSTTLSATTGPTSIPTSPSKGQTGSTNSVVTLTNNPTTAVIVPTSTTAVGTSLTSPSQVITNKACRALEARFVLGPMGLVLLLPYIL